MVVTASETGLRQVGRERQEKTQQMGTIVKEKRTKYMTVSATQKGRQTLNWKVGEIKYLKVSSFKYLGNVMH